MIRPFIFAVSLFFSASLKAASLDVVIPYHEKDNKTLEMCIKGIKGNGGKVRRVIVVSSKPCSSAAEWVDEALYPFTKEDVAAELPIRPADYSENRAGWYYQQLLKLYAHKVIEGLSDNALMLDSDTIFLDKVSFVDKKGRGLYNPGSEHHRCYFTHIEALTGSIVTKVFHDLSGISHHMLFQRSQIEELFSLVEGVHGIPFWKAFCRCVMEGCYPSGASEYELYFNYVFGKKGIAKMRPLKWANVTKLGQIKKYKKRGYHYVSCHQWSRRASGLR